MYNIISDTQEIFIMIYVVISLVLAGTLGDSRKIGSIYSFLFCITLTPIVGLLIILLSPTIVNSERNFKRLRMFFYWFFMIVGGIIVSLFGYALIDNLSQYSYYEHWKNNTYFWVEIYERDLIKSFECTILGIGLFILGLYLRKIKNS